MNNVQKGYYRDRQVLELVKTHGALDTDQVYCLLFSCRRMAQLRLKKLYEARRLKRCRLSQDTPYCYYLNQRPGQLEHLISVNWVYIWTLTRLASWEELTHWSYEVECGPIRADAFLGIRNRFTGETRFAFIEMDRSGSGNGWTKAEQYNRLFESGGYVGQWWVKTTKRFPAVLCVTDNGNRLNRIQKAINKANVNGLRFNAKLLNDLIREAKPCRQQG